ncbi:MAG TPA: hypothetical protein PLK40_01125 [Bacteroidaceae bacterium]|nr:hypothetical protein [Bacteroidaceae bacterium]
MKKLYSYKCFIVFSICIVLHCISIPTWGQIKHVHGTVINTDTKGAFEGVNVYGFHDAAKAEDLFRRLNMGNIKQIVSPDASAVTDQLGGFELELSRNGGLIFYTPGATPILRKLNGVLQVNVSMAGGIQLEEVTIKARLTKLTALAAETTKLGNKMYVENFPFPILQKWGKTNARLLIQSFCVPWGWRGDTLHGRRNDTVFMKHIVRDGEEYKTTQIRRQNFEKRRDKLLAMSAHAPRLTGQSDTIYWVDSVTLNQPEKPYIVKAVVLVEDYHRILRNDTILLSTGRSRDPMKYLEYNFCEALDMQTYRMPPKKEKRDVSGNITLSFLVGSSKLDPENPNNEIQLNKLRKELHDIVYGEESSLTYLQITGVSSPEGNYQTNIQLGKKRVLFARQEITKSIPNTHVATDAEAIVADWGEVADILRQDTLNDEAQKIQAIVDKYKNINDQYVQIRRLPFYKTTINDILPKLRTVKYKYRYDIFRKLTPEEILKKYQTNPDYHQCKVQIPLYEFWWLFQLVKDKKELEHLYKAAIAQSTQVLGKPGWVLPANLLAESYLSRDTLDLNLLQPYINYNIVEVDKEVRKLSGNGTIIVNPRGVIVNQIAMLLKAHEVSEASKLVQMLPNDQKNKEIKSYVYALLGYYKDPDYYDGIYNVLTHSTPLNKVVINMAFNTRYYDEKALEAIEELPKQDALAMYLKAIVMSRLDPNDTYTPAITLLMAFGKDNNYIVKAAADGDISDELFEQAYGMLEFNPQLDMEGKIAKSMEKIILEMKGDLCPTIYKQLTAHGHAKDKKMS